MTHMIHILDTEHPWEVHSVSSGHSEAITCLEWDQSGEAARSTLIDSQSLSSTKSRGAGCRSCPFGGLLMRPCRHRLPAAVGRR